MIQSHHALVPHLQYGADNTHLSAMLADEKVVIVIVFF